MCTKVVGCVANDAEEGKRERSEEAGAQVGFALAFSFKRGYWELFVQFWKNVGKANTLAHKGIRHLEGRKEAQGKEGVTD